MKITPEMQNDAREAVERELAYRDDDGRWAVLRQAVQDLEAANLEALQRALRLEALHHAVCPGVTKRQWSKALATEVPLEKRFHELRLAQAIAPREEEGET